MFKLMDKKIITLLHPMIYNFFFPDRTVVAVAGEDFSVIASDTRLSEGFSIHSRDQSKSYQLTKTTVLGACGFHGDVLTLTKLLKARLKVKEQQHETFT